jgi:hypothetical protein
VNNKAKDWDFSRDQYSKLIIKLETGITEGNEEAD